MNEITRRGMLKTATAFAAASLPEAVLADDNVNGQLGFIYVGSYTGRGLGIYLFRRNPATGDLTQVATTNPTVTSPTISNPSFLAVHPNRRYLYCVNENSFGTVTSFSINQANGLL